MKESQLEKMNVKELRELRAKIDSAISARQTKDKAELRVRMQEMADEAGLTLDEVVGGSRRGGSKGGKGSVPVKYRHHDDSSMTWTGRGRRPKWLEGIANIEKFRV